MKYAFLAFAFFAASLVHANAFPTVGFSYCDEDNAPPAEYDFEPNVPYAVAPVPPDIVGAICWVRDRPAIWQVACVIDDGDLRIIVRNDLTPTERKCVMRHERAHLNGWAHDYEKPNPMPRGRRGHLLKYTPLP